MLVCEILRRTSGCEFIEIDLSTVAHRNRFCQSRHWIHTLHKHLCNTPHFSLSLWWVYSTHDSSWFSADRNLMNTPCLLMVLSLFCQAMYPLACHTVLLYNVLHFIYTSFNCWSVSLFMLLHCPTVFMLHVVTCACQACSATSPLHWFIRASVFVPVKFS